MKIDFFDIEKDEIIFQSEMNEMPRVGERVYLPVGKCFDVRSIEWFIGDSLVSVDIWLMPVATDND